MKNKILTIDIFALAAYGRGLSGGDRIFIEFARRWSKKFPVTIHVWREGYEMCKRQGLKQSKEVRFMIYDLGIFCKLGFFICYLARIFLGIRIGLSFKLQSKEPTTIVYSASEFWMDSVPALILKLRYPKVRWVAAWYQTAPNPLRGYAEHSAKSTVHRKSDAKYFLSAFSYWLVQLPIKPIISKYADFVLVNNEEEKKQFPLLNKKGRTIVVLGAVPLEDIQKYLSVNRPRRSQPGHLRGDLKGSSDGKGWEYDAVFQGRFHSQKGVLELIDIWKKVVEERSNARLAVIGDGPLMENVKTQISKFKLNKNVKLFGYLFDGPKKYSIFNSSKIVVHPAFYDSGGMAAAEAMAFGLPCVGFNLKAYESYYPKGMVKAPLGDIKAFSNEILKLLNDEKYYKIHAKEAKEFIEKNYSWNVRAEEVYRNISSKL